MSPGERHPFRVRCTWRVVATFNSPRGVGAHLASLSLSRADGTLLRHTRPHKSGFGTDLWEGVSSWPPHGPPVRTKTYGGSVTILLRPPDGRAAECLLPAGHSDYVPLWGSASYLPWSTCTQVQVLWGCLTDSDYFVFSTRPWGTAVRACMKVCLTGGQCKPRKPVGSHG